MHSCAPFRHERLPEIRVICLRTGMVHPALLLHECASCFECQPGSRWVHILEVEDGFEPVAFDWPLTAS